METREFCVDFVKGKCYNNLSCKYAHVIMKDKESFLNTYKEIGIKPTNEEQDFKLYDPPVGSRRWMTKCRDCEVMHYFDYHIRKGSLESLYCRKCVDKYKEQIKENFNEDFNQDFMSL
jgi:hypothetical protein